MERGHQRDSIHFVGAARGNEARLVPAAGFEITLLPGRGLQRSLGLVANARSALGLVKAAGSALMLLRRLRPLVVVSVGGYAAAAATSAAIVLGIPVIVADSNAVAGRANKLFGRWAAASATAFEDVDLPRAVVTGSPVRDAIYEVSRSQEARAEARKAMGLPEDRVIIGVIGGSLGARRINTAVAGLVRAWSKRSDVAIRHAVGSRDWDTYCADLPHPQEGGLLYQPVEYEDHMELLYSAADLMVTRAGGSTCAELGVVGVGAVMVPLPGAPGDHQTANGTQMAKSGAVELIPDPSCTADHLAAVLGDLVMDPDRLEAMAAAAARAGRRDAASAVAALAERHALPERHAKRTRGEGDRS